MKKTAKLALLGAIVATVLSAGAMSVRQLSTTPKAVAICKGGTCSATVSCNSTCFCSIQSGQTTGFCTQDPIGPSRPK